MSKQAVHRLGMRKGMLLLLLTTSNVVAVFLAQIFVLAGIGPGNATDAFLAAATVPQLLTGIVSAAIFSVVVPLLSGEPRERENSCAWILTLVVGTIFLLLAVLLTASLGWWTPLLFPGFSVEDRELCERLAGIQMHSMVFGAAASVVAAFCYARGQFVRVELTILCAALTTILFLYIFLPRMGITAAAWSFTLTPFIQLMLLLPALGKPAPAGNGLHLAAQAWRQIKPVLAGSMYHKSEIIVDRYLLSMAGSGEMTLFGLAQQIHGALAGIIGKVWGNTVIPGLSVFAKQGESGRFAELFRRHLLWLTGISGGCYLILLLGGQFGLSLLVGHGKVSASDIGVLWLLIACMGGVLVFGSLGVLISGAFYAMGDVKTPLLVSVASFTVFIVLKFLAFRWFGATGVALAASGYYALNAMLLAGILSRVWRRKLIAGAGG